MPEQIRLPDGWTVVDTDGSPYKKFVKRDAVTVPKRSPDDAKFDRDAVVLVTDSVAGVVKGPGARQSWQTTNPEAVGRALVDVLEEWTREGRDPYGGEELDDDLDAAAQEVIA